MAHINLLPWREAQRSRQQNTYLAILGSSAGLALLVMYLISGVVGGVIDGQRHRNAYLQQEIRLLDTQIEEIKKLRERKTELAQRIDLIADLQKNRNMVTRIFNDIASSVPGGVYLLELDRKGGTIDIVGKSESNNHLSNLMRRVGNSTWLSNPSLRSIEADKEEPKLSRFSMRLDVKGEVKPADKDGNKRQPARGAKR